MRHRHCWSLQQSIVNPASSVNKMLATNCVFKMNFERSDWQKKHFCTMDKGRGGLPLLNVVCIKGLFVHNYPGKGKTDTFSSCNSSHTLYGVFSILLNMRTAISGFRNDQGLARSDARGTKDTDCISNWRSFVINLRGLILRCRCSA